MDATKLHLLLNYIPLIGIVDRVIFLTLWNPTACRATAQKMGLGLLVVDGVVTLGVFRNG